MHAWALHAASEVHSCSMRGGGQHCMRIDHLHYSLRHARLACACRPACMGPIDIDTGQPSCDCHTCCKGLRMHNTSAMCVGQSVCRKQGQTSQTTAQHRVVCITAGVLQHRREYSAVEGLGSLWLWQLVGAWPGRRACLTAQRALQQLHVRKTTVLAESCAWG